MFEQVNEILKSKDILVPRLLLFNYKKLNIEDQEFIVIMYLLNISNMVYNPQRISNDLNIELDQVLMIVNNITEKGLIKTEMVQKNGKIYEIVRLDELFSKLTFLLIDDKKNETNDTIYSLYENEIGRTLSSMELEFISAWRDNNYSDELILLALKEAVYNGTTSFKYIDRILEEWRKKNIKTKEDVEKNRKAFQERKNKKVVNGEVFTYDWLNDEE